jgi:hypothetical protein
VLSRVSDPLGIFEQTRFDKEGSDGVDYFHSTSQLSRSECEGEWTYEGGPEGFAMGNKPWRGRV